ncbi:MAG: polyprenol monophosphomannose synthase [Candidatus Kerfeldbacteria bacterium]|nr:polyprenol monophosphomannose synthase [Candidatus Kerfeldbacteria bacterium]
MSIWIVVPTYNEAENLESLLQRIFSTIDAHVLVVDDASPDGTGQLAERLRHRWPQLDVLHRPGKAGLASAYMDGLRLVLSRNPTAIVHLDADGSHPPELIPTMLDALATTDLVLASRYVPGGTMGISPHRRLISAVGNWYIRGMLGTQIRDWSTGFKAWNPVLLARVLATDLRSQGYACLMEMNWRALQADATVAEIPLFFSERRAGDSKFSLNIIWEDIRLAWQLRRSR